MLSPALPGFHDLDALDAWRDFVRAEFDHQRRAHRERRAQPIVQRIEKGTCLAGLRLLSIDGTHAKFSHGGNDSRLREGDAVSLGRAEWEGKAATGTGGPHPPPLRAFLFREEQEQLWLYCESGFPRHLAERFGSDGWHLDEAFLDLEHLYLDALDAVERSAIGQSRILPLLSEEATLELDDGEYGAAIDELRESPGSWEDAQQDAIAACLATDHCYLVQGPPGTGKTRVLAEVVSRLVARGERVLLTAFTHRAIDHALSACAAAIGERERVARFAAPRHRRGENFDLHEQFAESPLADLSGGWLAAATPFALRARLPEVEFDAIVIDEAGQMSTPLAIMAMLAGPKYLLFGDQRQLGPVVLSRPRREAGSVGIFHTLRARSSGGTLLDVTYRLNDVLARWPAENFYGGELAPAPAVAPRRLAWAPPSGLDRRIAEALAPEHPLVHVPSHSNASRTRNREEASLAAELIRALCRGGIAPEDAAVVTPYRSQARQIRKALETLDPGGSWDAVLIDTVERMQGQEREVVLLSLCASEPRFLQKQAEFLLDPRRLNVGATRARNKLIVLASGALLDLDLDDTDLLEDLDLLRSLCASAREVLISDDPETGSDPLP